MLQTGHYSRVKIFEFCPPKNQKNIFNEKSYFLLGSNYCSLTSNEVFSQP